MFDLSQPCAMGIVNVTPDSFSDGGCFIHPDRAVERALDMVEQGASIVDVGGESTRPGAQAISVQQEVDRVLPVIEVLTGEINVPVSIDTSKAEVMRMAVSAGAEMINDVRALREDGALQACADLNVPVCLVHMQGLPRTMQQFPDYPDGVISELNIFFTKHIERAVEAGVSRDNVFIDPGFGFGKTLQHNYQLLRGLEDFSIHEVPVLVGISRKSMIGNLLDLPVEERLPGSLSAVVIAAMKGANIFRVHDVKATVEALKVVDAMHHADELENWGAG